MNERIRELAEQASHQSPDGYPVTIPYSKDFAEKFAQLIVAECIKKCEFVAAMAEITNTGEMARKIKATADSCAQMIEQYFGIEE